MGLPAAALPGGWRLSSRRLQAMLAQVAGAVVLVVAAGLLGLTLVENLVRLNLSAGFGFLLRPAGMQIGESVIPFDASDSFAWAMVAALVNTLRVSAAAIVLATVVGTAVGVMRLSANPLLRGITAVYVELFRNTPVLLQILFWSAVLLKLPAVRQAITLGDWAFLSQRGLQIPAIVLHGNVQAWPALAAAVVVGAGVGMALHRRGRAAMLASGLAAALATGLGGLALQGALGIDRPVRKPFGYTGGLMLTPEFCALLAGLVIYTGAFIAEIVRGGILAIPRGQWEAARSLGLHDAAILRRIVLPQALRIILPSLTSQYVGIVKNSSLAVAIGYPDFFWAVSTTINVTGHAVEGVAVMMAGYLVLTLGTSGAMNSWYARMLRRGAR